MSHAWGIRTSAGVRSGALLRSPLGTPAGASPTSGTPTSSDTQPPPPGKPGKPGKPRSRWGKFWRWTVALVLTVALAAGSTAAFLAWQTNKQVVRISSVFTELRERPAAPTGAAAGSTNILLLGTDTRSDEATTGSAATAASWTPGGQRTDTMMVLHIGADRRSAGLISIPRDSWVSIPGHGKAKVNAAYSLGGPALTVATVEQLTGVRINHLAVVDWAGYKAMIDQLGGIDVTVPKTVYDSYRKHTWTAGKHRLDGAGALLYARERSGLPGGDLDRVKRQQAVLRALSTRAVTAASDPIRAYQLVNAVGKHLSIDDTWGIPELMKLAMSLRQMKTSDISYLTIPTAGTGMTDGQSVVWINEAKAKGLWKAVNKDELTAWVDANRGALTTGVVR